MTNDCHSLLASLPPGALEFGLVFKTPPTRAPSLPTYTSHLTHATHTQVPISRLFDPRAPHSLSLGPLRLNVQPSNSLGVAVSVAAAAAAGGDVGGGGGGKKAAVVVRDVGGEQLVTIEPGAQAEVRRACVCVCVCVLCVSVCVLEKRERARTCVCARCVVSHSTIARATAMSASPPPHTHLQLLA